eukprot:XP_025980085.1 transcription factor IIIA-like [Glycine max]
MVSSPTEFTEIEGLKRKLTSKLGANSSVVVPDWWLLSSLLDWIVALFLDCAAHHHRWSLSYLLDCCFDFGPCCSSSQEEAENERAKRVLEEETVKSSNMCEECGANFKKHTYLLQHVQSHSLEIRPYVCSAGNCQACYRRKDHLTCHLLQHQGKVFKCPVESCNTEFSLQSNMKGRVEETHEDSSTSTSDKSYKQHACPETGCGKVFRFALQL